MKLKNAMPAMLAVFLCAACTDMFVSKAPPVYQGPLPAPYPSKAPDIVRATPIPPHEIDIAGNCKRTEEDGFREDATVRVSHNAVQTLTWKLWVSRRGWCHFDLAEFKQVQQTPHIELHAIDGSGCTLMVWQDPRRITLAHARCEKHCTPGIYDEAWPVLFDPRSGGCAQIR